MYAEDSKILPEVRDSVNSFIKKVGIGNHQEAINDLFASKAKWGGREQMMKMTNDMQIFREEVVGKPISCEISKIKYLSQSYLSVTAMVTFERQPIFLMINFYRPGDHFNVDNFSVETDVDESSKKGFFNGDLVNEAIYKFKTDEKF